MKMFLCGLVLLISLAACEENQTVILEGFTAREVLLTESERLYEVVFDLGNGVSTSTTFTFTISGTAGMEADYRITTPYRAIDLGNGVTKVSGLEAAATTTSQLQYVVVPGQKSISIPVKIMDDHQIEPGYETIQLTITDISTEGLEVTNASVNLLIDDEDVPASDAVQVDLSWQLASGGSINASNFDLYLVKNVKFNSSGTTYELVSGISSELDSGFESLRLDELLPDEQYYVMISYRSGSVSARVVLVISQDNDVRTASGQVSSQQVGSNLFFGPITKSSNGFSYRQTGNEAAFID